MAIGVFIAVRTASSRLPNKCLLQIEGKTVIEHLISRIKFSKKRDVVVICTTESPADDILVEIARRNRIEYFRGEEEDILQRYLGAAQRFGVEHIVTADGDDIFCDPFYIDLVAERLLSHGKDFVKIEGLPFGTFPCGMSRFALKTVCEFKDEENTEGWGRYFMNIPGVKVDIIQALPQHSHPEYRLTLDYQEDFQVLREIFDNLYMDGGLITLDEIFNFLKDRPDLIAINAARQGDYLARFKERYSEVKLKRRIR